MLNVVKYKWIFLGIAILLVAASLVALGLFRLRLGLDFTGGGLWQFNVPSGNATAPDIADALKPIVPDAQITTLGNNQFMVRFGETDASTYQNVRQAIIAKYPAFQETSFSSVGPSVSGKLRRNALLAIIFVLIAISLYIMFAFRKATGPVKPWAYGVATMVTLLHDVAIPAGMLAILGRYAHIEIDTNFVVALLVVMGFSVHDTIVVFDRIRENLLRTTDKRDFAGIVNASVTQTLARSINTSLTLVLVLIALIIAGPVSLHYFVLTLLVGVTAGAYSSIFVASPLLQVIGRRGLAGNPQKRA
jgi:preprotein translocase subunit SecF